MVRGWKCRLVRWSEAPPAQVSGEQSVIRMVLEIRSDLIIFRGPSSEDAPTISSSFISPSFITPSFISPSVHPSSVVLESVGPYIIFLLPSAPYLFICHPSFVIFLPLVDPASSSLHQSVLPSFSFCLSVPTSSFCRSSCCCPSINCLQSSPSSTFWDDGIFLSCVLVFRQSSVCLLVSYVFILPSFIPLLLSSSR